MPDETITAYMVAKYLQTQVTPETPVVLTGGEFDGDGQFVALEDVLNEIAMEPERYQEDT